MTPKMRRIVAFILKKGLINKHMLKGHKEYPIREFTSEDLKDALIIGGYYFEGGLREFDKWAEKMIDDIGEAVKPHLKTLYEDAKAEIETYYAEHRLDLLPEVSSIEEKQGHPNSIKEDRIMNDKQKKCLWLGIVLIVVMGLFPPWICEREHKRSRGFGNGDKWEYTIEPGHYSWIGSPPKAEHLGSGRFLRPKCIDLYRLGIQYFIVATVTTGLIIALRDKEQLPSDESEQDC